MKKASNISADAYFYLLLSFVFMLNFSIAYCYISGIILLAAAVFHHVYHRLPPVFPRPFLVFFLFSSRKTTFSVRPGK